MSNETLTQEELPLVFPEVAPTPPPALNSFSMNFIDTITSNLFVYKLVNDTIGDVIEMWKGWENIIRQGLNAKVVSPAMNIVDVYSGDTAWSCKVESVNNLSNAVKNKDIISGRMDIAKVFSIKTAILEVPAEEMGRMVLEIWNSRVEKAMKKFRTVRQMILFYDTKNMSFMFYEEDVVKYNHADYEWKWDDGVLHGYDPKTGSRKFAYQTSGTQFRIMSEVPESCRKITIEPPPPSVSQALRKYFLDVKYSVRMERQLELNL